jgi:hypothetical protein
MKLPFFIETQLNKILKPQIVTIVETFIDGKPSRKFYGKSLVANYLQYIYGSGHQDNVAFLASGAPFNSLSTALRIDTGGATASIKALQVRIEAAAGITNQGIVLGSAAVVPAPASFNVGTLIAHGAGANQLQYGTMGSIQGVNIVGQNSNFIFQRTFTNSSGGNVTCRAIALYTNVIAGGMMVYLDSVAPDDVIGNGQVYTVQLTYQITT